MRRTGKSGCFVSVSWVSNGGKTRRGLHNLFPFPHESGCGSFLSFSPCANEARAPSLASREELHGGGASGAPRDMSLAVIATYR